MVAGGNLADLAVEGHVGGDICGHACRLGRQAACDLAMKSRIVRLPLSQCKSDPIVTARDEHPHAVRSWRLTTALQFAGQQNRRDAGRPHSRLRQGSCDVAPRRHPGAGSASNPQCSTQLNSSKTLPPKASPCSAILALPRTRSTWARTARLSRLTSRPARQARPFNWSIEVSVLVWPPWA